MMFRFFVASRLSHRPFTDLGEALIYARYLTERGIDVRMGGIVDV